MRIGCYDSSATDKSGFSEKEIKMPISKKEILRHWTEKEVQMQNIIKNRDWNALFSMDENDDFSWTLEQILWSFVTKSVKRYKHWTI